MRERPAVTSIVKENRFYSILLVCWYVTIVSAPFGSYLLRVQLPPMGNFFLFRGALLATCFVYLAYLVRRRENPFSGLSKAERAFAASAAALLLYGALSVLWAINLGAWFSKFFNLCLMLALVFLFLKLCASPRILRNTLFLIAASTLVCGLAAMVETFRGPLFADTIHRDTVYDFFGRGMYYPVFTFVNPNDACEYLFFSLEVLFLYMAHRWGENSQAVNKRTLLGLSCAAMLMIFLACVGQGRLIILSLIVFLAGLFVWLALRYRRGLAVFLLFAAFLGFIYVGENYAQIKYGVETKIEEIFKNGTPDASQPEPGASQPTPAPPDPNIHAALYTIVPSVTRDGLAEDVARSDNYRLKLIESAFQLLAQSKGLGIGLGNAEIRVGELMGYGKPVALHCYVAELFAEFGFFVIIPLAALVILILKSWWKSFSQGLRRKDIAGCADVLFLLFTAAAFPLASTASSSSRAIAAMWLYMAVIILITGGMEHSLKLSSGGNGGLGGYP